MQDTRSYLIRLNLIFCLKLPGSQMKNGKIFMIFMIQKK